VRVPSLFELMGDRGFFVGQPDLEAEKSIATDIGIAYDRATIKGSVVAFHRDIDDALVVSYNSRGVGAYQNIAQAEITGAELSFDYNLPLNVLLLLRTTLQEPRDKSNLSDRAGDVLPSVYRHASNITLMHCYSRFESRLEYAVEEGGYYSPGEVSEIPDKKLLNFYFAYLQNGLQVSFEAKNLLDEQYEDFYLFPAPGRNYFIKASQEF
jgi:iron complex outermembrane receptor protein